MAAIVDVQPASLAYDDVQHAISREVAKSDVMRAEPGDLWGFLGENPVVVEVKSGA